MLSFLHYDALQTQVENQQTVQYNRHESLQKAIATGQESLTNMMNGLKEQIDVMGLQSQQNIPSASDINTLPRSLGFEHSNTIFAASI